MRNRDRLNDRAMGGKRVRKEAVKGDAKLDEDIKLLPV